MPNPSDYEEFLEWKKNKTPLDSVICDHCKCKIENEEIYYKCKQHKCVFCENCAKIGQNVHQCNYSEAPHCKDKRGVTLFNCEWEKLIS